ncbi:MAG: 2-oxopent-4-enoate hydratase [Frankiales bacterium]|nr:2-oxopent-4-enoate hydratase [Frankiales bacterium]
MAEAPAHRDGADITHSTQEPADLLWQARHGGGGLDPNQPPWSELTASAAAAISDALYDRGGRTRSWKLGALDAPTQQRLGISRPICQPLLDGATWTNVSETTVALDGLIAPRFEPEIGILIEGERLIAVPCVEIADCRFDGWRLPPFGMTVELGLQALMLFGEPGEVTPDVTVVVTRDTEVVVSGRASWDEAVARLDLLPSREVADRVATGSITPMFDCTPGRWRFDFGGLGAIVVNVQ